MPTISTVAQGGAQRSEKDLEARTDEGARAARPPAGAGAIMRQPRRVWLRSKKIARAAQRERAPPARAAPERHELAGRRSPLDHRQRFAPERPSRRGEAECRREDAREATSRRRRTRGKAAGVASAACGGSDPGEWSRSGDESPEAAVSAGAKASRSATNGPSRNRSEAPERRMLRRAVITGDSRDRGVAGCPR